jgi:hypothetical protein
MKKQPNAHAKSGPIGLRCLQPPKAREREIGRGIEEEKDTVPVPSVQSFTLHRTLF